MVKESLRPDECVGEILLPGVTTTMAVEPADAASSIIDQFPEDVSLQEVDVDGRIHMST